MEEKLYTILGHDICVTGDCGGLKSIDRFRKKEYCQPDLTITIDQGVLSDSCYGLQYLSPERNQIKQIFFSSKDRSHFTYTTADDYSNLHMSIGNHCEEEVFLELLISGFYSFAALKEALLLHASAVSYKGEGIVFTAESGTGKTTQAELWAKHKNAAILNGDKVFIKKEEDHMYAWGSPWKGSSEYAENEKAELKAIVILEQADVNSIRLLEGLERMERLIPHVFYPQWDSRCEQAVFSMLDQILRNSKVYLLKCRPDEDAVRMAEEAILG